MTRDRKARPLLQDQRTDEVADASFTHAVERRDFLALGGATITSIAALAAGFTGCAAPSSPAREEFLGEASTSEADPLVRAWFDFCESLKGAAMPLLETPAQSAEERASALRYLTRLVSQTFDHAIEYDDPKFPQLFRSQGPTSQQGGPNPDTSYIDARIDGESVYRLFGQRGGVHFVTFSTMRGMDALRAGKPGLVENLLGDALQVDVDGRFEVRIGRTRPAGYAGNFLKTTADTERLTIREIFGDWENEDPMDLHLERVGGEGEIRPPIEFDDIAARVRSVGSRVAFMSDFWVQDVARFKDRPNEFLEYQERDPYKRSIAYTPGGRALVGVWKVDPDEALVIEVTPPESPYWAYELGDYFFEVDYYGGLSGVNHHQMVVDADGIARTIVSHVDPGGWPNWLSTSGHHIGHMVFRWLDSEEEVLPKATLVPLTELGRRLPASTPRLSAATRAAQIASRRAGLRRRWPV